MRLNEQQEATLLALLKQGRGTIRAEDVVETARDPGNPLHKLIGWDRSDDELAARYRLDRARLAIQLLQLRHSEEVQREIGKAKSAEDRERLRNLAKQLEQAGARRTISYGTAGADREYRDIVVEFRNGKEDQVYSQLLKEFEVFVHRRAVLHPLMHKALLPVLAAAERRFDEPNAAKAGKRTRTGERV